MATPLPEGATPISAEERNSRTPLPKGATPLGNVTGRGASPVAGESAAGIGIAEAGLSMASAFPAAVMGGLAGMGTPLVSGIVPPARENIDYIRDFFTYEPRTEEGKQALETAAHYIEEAANTLKAGFAGMPQLLKGDISGSAETIKNVRDIGAGEAALQAGASPLEATAADVGLDAILVSMGASAPKLPRTRTTRNAPASKTTRVAYDEISKRAGLDETPIAELAEKGQRLGPEGTAADVAGASTGGLVTRTTNATAAGRTIRQRITDRVLDARERMVSFIDNSILNGKSRAGENRRIQRSLKEDTGGDYGAAYNHGLRATDDLNAALSEPVITKEILDVAKTDIQQAHRTTLTPQQKADALRFFEGDAVSPQATMIAVDYLYKSINKAIKNADGANLYNLIKAKKDIYAAIERQNNFYIDAVGNYHALKAQQEALDLGWKAKSDMRSLGEDVVIDAFGRMSPEEQAAFSVGYASRIKNEIRNRPRPGAGDTEAVSVLSEFRGTPAAENLMDTILGGGDDFANFLKMGEQERAFFQTSKDVNLQSAGVDALQRAFNRKGIKALVGKAGKLGADALFAANYGNLFATRRLIVEYTGGKVRRLTREESSEIARLLATPEGTQELLTMARAGGPQSRTAQTLMNMSPTNIANWFRSKQNLTEFMRTAAVADIVLSAQEETE